MKAANGGTLDGRRQALWTQGGGEGSKRCGEGSKRCGEGREGAWEGSG